MARNVKVVSAGMKALLNSSEVRAMLTDRAQPVLAAAKADPHDDTGAYENGLQIQQATTDRAVVRVVSTDFKGHILEARYGILSRALDQAAGA